MEAKDKPVSVWNKSDCEDVDEDGMNSTLPLPDEDPDNIEADTEDDCDPATWYQPSDAENTAAPPAEVYPSRPSSLNNSMWDQDGSEGCSLGLDFVSQQLTKVASFSCLDVVSTRTGKLRCLTNPQDVLYLPELNQFLVSELFNDRIGVYNDHEDGLQFDSWLAHPRHPLYRRPASMLRTSNGHVFIVEGDRIQILTSYLEEFMWKRGHFRGLAEGPGGEVFTLAISSRSKSWHLQKLEIGPNGFYKFAGQIELTCISSFNETKLVSRACNLTYNKDRIYITDMGLHKIYVVNLVTGTQSILGCEGAGEGQFSMPSGIVSDDVGNILVADKGNKRLLVFSEMGQFIKVANCGDAEIPDNIQSLRVFREHVYVVHRTSRGKMGGIIKLKLTAV